MLSVYLREMTVGSEKLYCKLIYDSGRVVETMPLSALEYANLLDSYRNSEQRVFKCEVNDLIFSVLGEG